MKKLLSGIIFLCLVVTGLFIALISRSDRPARAHTAVARQYTRITATPADTFQISGLVHLLANSGNQLYALDQKARVIFRIDPHSGSSNIVARHGQYFPEIPASLHVDSSGIYCFAANQKMIFRFPLQGGAADSLSGAKLPFSRGARLSDSSVFIHHYDTINRKAHFMLADYRHGGQLVSHLYDFPHEDDGGLASDGQALTAGNQLPVIYFQHHNSIVYVWDTTGFRTFQTIDSTPAINNIIRGDNSWSISSKTQFINLDGATDGRYFFVLSNAVSHNQPTSAPEIDIYRIPDGAYSGSLRLPPHEKSGVRHITVANGHLYASHQHHIIAYQLNMP